jgi:hypothetical protein
MLRVEEVLFCYNLIVTTSYTAKGSTEVMNDQLRFIKISKRVKILYVKFLFLKMINDLAINPFKLK